MRNIRQVVEKRLCTSCGTCIGICPVDAVKIYILGGLVLPEVDENKCADCGLCVKCCPGSDVDFQALNSEVFGVQPQDYFLGNYLVCYVGYSSDYDVRYNAASGGVATQLLIHCLEKGLIDGAVVTRMSRNNPLMSESFIARTREEVISASRSKYCPTSPNKILKQVLEEDGKFAFVGLPCQVHGVRKAEMYVKDLKEKIVLHVGLFCSHTVNQNGTIFLLRKLGLLPENVEEIAYRGQGWPGRMFIELVNGDKLTFPYSGCWNSYWPIFSSFFFTPSRCLMCLDETNEFADISVGDAWLRRFKKDNIGRSLIVVRTNKGMEIIESALSEGVIFLQNIGPEEVKLSQSEPLKFKKEDIHSRLALLRAFGIKVPNFNLNSCNLSSYNFSSMLRNFFVLFNLKLSERKSLEKFLVFVPFPIFRLYYGVYKFLCAI